MAAVDGVPVEDRLAQGAASTCRVRPTLSGCARGGHCVDVVSFVRSLNIDVIPDVIPDGNPEGIPVEVFCRHCSCIVGAVPEIKDNSD